MPDWNSVVLLIILYKLVEDMAWNTKGELVDVWEKSSK